MYSFTHTDEDYYVRELSVLIKEDPGNLSRELRRLEAEGLYNSATRGKIKLYSLNKNYPLFQELKKIVFKTEGVEGSLRNIVSKYKGITTAFIYGSYAKDAEDKASDIDLILVGDFPVNRLARDIRELEHKLNREVNFTFYGDKEFLSERKKKGSFLSLVVAGKIIMLKGKI